MTKRSSVFLRAGLAILAMGWCGAAFAADPPADAKLREALRSAITQLRAAEDEQAVLKAKQAESAKEAEVLKAQVQEMTKRLADGDARQGEQEKTLLDRDQRLESLGETLEKWKAAYAEAVNVARTKEAQRLVLTSRVEQTSKQVESCEAKNVDLYKVGTEILDRYSKVGVVDAFETREPFVGYKRVELQNLVQDYEDKLRDGRIQ